MRRSVPGFACLAALACVGASAAPAPEPAQWAGARDLADLRREGALASNQAARARIRADELDRRAGAARDASAAATLRAAALATRVQQQEAAVAAAESTRKLLGARRARLDARLSEQRAPIARLMAGLQSLVRRPPVVALMQPLSLEDTVHLRAVFAAVGPQIRRRTANLQTELERAKSLEREASALAAQRRRLRADLEASREALLAVSAAQQLKARRAASAADLEAERAFAMAETARSLGGLAARVESASRQPRAPTAGSPAALFQPPVLGPTEPSKRGAGKGITYLPAPGAQVVAPRQGRVAFAGPYRGYGTVVILEHADGWTSLVTGLASRQVVVGQRVVTGSPLGRAPARLPTITLEVRRGGLAVRADEVVR